MYAINHVLLYQSTRTCMSVYVRDVILAELLHSYAHTLDYVIIIVDKNKHASLLEHMLDLKLSSTCLCCTGNFSYWITEIKLMEPIVHSLYNYVIQ